MSSLSLPYVIITPARNEEAFIEGTIHAMAAQTVKPLKWVIVNDGSTDSTSNIVRSFLADHPWIELVDLPVRRERSFAAKVFAFNAGEERVKNLNYALIGNLDADISPAENCLEFLQNEFRKDPELGVAGPIFKEHGYSSEKDSFEGQNHVAGGCQLFRRTCFEEIGGYKPNKAGGIDWVAVTTARMMGWRTKSFRERHCFHHRRLGTAERGRLASSFSYGEKDYYLGNHPVWEFFRIAYRMTKPPYLIDGLAVGFGYCWALVSRQKLAVSEQLKQFHRREQMQKLKVIFRSLMQEKNVDSFEVKPN